MHGSAAKCLRGRNGERRFLGRGYIVARLNAREMECPGTIGDGFIVIVLEVQTYSDAAEAHSRNAVDDHSFDGPGVLTPERCRQ
jgi:hypothetical protein